MIPLHEQSLRSSRDISFFVYRSTDPPSIRLPLYHHALNLISQLPHAHFHRLRPQSWPYSNPIGLDSHRPHQRQCALPTNFRHLASGINATTQGHLCTAMRRKSPRDHAEQPQRSLRHHLGRWRHYELLMGRPFARRCARRGRLDRTEEDRGCC